MFEWRPGRSCGSRQAAERLDEKRWEACSSAGSNRSASPSDEAGMTLSDNPTWIALTQGTIEARSRSQAPPLRTGLVTGDVAAALLTAERETPNHTCEPAGPVDFGRCERGARRPVASTPSRPGPRSRGTSPRCRNLCADGWRRVGTVTLCSVTCLEDAVSSPIKVRTVGGSR